MKEYQKLTTEQLIGIIKKTKNVSIKRELESEIYDRNLGFIHIALKNVPRPEHEDFMQYSYLFFLRAIGGFESGHGNKFGVYLIWWLRAAVSTYNREKLGTMHNKKKIKGFNVPSEEADHLYIIPWDGKPKVEVKRSMSSLLLNDTRTLEDTLISTDKNAEEEYADTERSELSTEILSNLVPREARVMRLYFGINGKKCTLKEIGDLEGVSLERIRQLRDSAFRNIKNRYGDIEDINLRKKYDKNKH